LRKYLFAQEEARVAPMLDSHEAGQFGDLRLIQSRYQSARVWASIKDLEPSRADTTVWLRARIHSSRSKGARGLLSGST
jgi:hypothetical protein